MVHSSRNVLRAAAFICMTTAALSVHSQAPSDNTRWISGTGVTLRAEASPTADILARLGLNKAVQLIGPAGTGPYCEINTTGAGGATLRGFTACRYLALKPTDLPKVVGSRTADGEASSNYDPEKAFAMFPTWETLQSYVHFLEATRLSDEDRAHPPRGVAADPLLERMKEHLAKGVHGPTPPALADWAEVKRKAALNVEGVEYADQRPEVMVNLVNAIELPVVRPSLLMQAADIAPPGEAAPEISGRFGIIHLWRTKPRTPQGSDITYGGVWDIRSATASLARPVVGVTVYRDGRLDTSRTHAPRTIELRSEYLDAPGCENYEPGFAYGDAEPRMWQALGYDVTNKRAPNSVVRFHLRKELPAPAAQMATTHHKLDRQATGFIKATAMHFDLDHDGVFDLSVWEGTGHGPGHMDARTDTDDAWLRLFFVNIGGHWKLLGTDVFGYGCGC